MGKLLYQFTDEKINQIKTHPMFKCARENAMAMADKYADEPIAPLTLEKYREYSRTGNRSIYENVFFDRRKRLATLAFAALIYKEEKYIKALEEVIWQISNEYTWEVPAHVRDEFPMEYQKTTLALFACETGSALSEIYYLAGDMLSPFIRERIVCEVKNRIIDAYETAKEEYLWWSDTKSNWAAVCAGSIAICYFIIAPERYGAVSERIKRTIESFMSSYGSDCCCSEGVGYWTYGFGYYTYFAEALYEFTDGKEDYFSLPFTKKAARFINTMRMDNSCSVSFSDMGYSPDKKYEFSYPLAVCALYQEKYGKDYTLAPFRFAEEGALDGCARWCKFIRYFLWTDPDKLEFSEKGVPFAYYGEAGWYIRNKQAFSLAAKAGNNAEPHNHNDIGSFIFYSGDKHITDDFGAGEYTREYFAADTRYSHFVCCSASHSVPIINGAGQKEGEEHFGKVLCADESVFSSEISKAYDDDTLKSLVRTFELSDDGFTLTDEFDFSSEASVTERIVTRILPKEEKGRFKIADSYIEFDESVFAPSIKEFSYRLHHCGDATVYAIDLAAKKPVKKAALKIHFKAR